MKELDPIEIDGKSKPAIVVLNAESRKLPFPERGRFTNLPINTRKTADGKVERKASDILRDAVRSVSKAEHIKVVILESLTRLTSRVTRNELSLFKQKISERNSRKGTDTEGNMMQAWGEVGYDTADILEDVIGSINDKLVIVTAHEDAPRDEDFDRRMRVPLAGRMIKQGVESHFDVVLWTQTVQDDNGNIKHVFQTNANTTNRAKSPVGMFSDEEMYIDNDITFVIDRMREYYQEDDISKLGKILIVGSTATGKSTSFRNL